MTQENIITQVELIEYPLIPKYKKFDRFQEALEVIDKKLLELGGNSELYSELYLKKGKILAELERYEEAIEVYDKVIEDHGLGAWVGYNAEAWGFKGIIYEKFKRYEEALKSYDKAIEGMLGHMSHSYNLYIEALAKAQFR